MILLQYLVHIITLFAIKAYNFKKYKFHKIVLKNMAEFNPHSIQGFYGKMLKEYLEENKHKEAKNVFFIKTLEGKTITLSYYSFFTI